MSLIKKIGIKKVMTVIVAVFILLGLMATTLEIRAAQIHTIPNASLGTIVKAVNVNMGKNNLSGYKWKSISGKVVRDEGGTYYFSVPIKSVTSTFSYSNVLELNFTDVMNIGGRKVNAKIDINSISVNKPYWVSGQEDGYLSFMQIYSTSIGFGSDGVSSPYRGRKDTNITITFTYADTGEKINVPMYQILNDIDVADQGADYKEGWQGFSGYTGDIFTFENCELDIDLQRMKLTATNLTEGDDQWLKSGAIVPINSAVITQTFSAAFASTGMYLYSPFDDKNMPSPVKTADNQYNGKEKIYDNGQTIIWDVSQKLHTWNADIFTLYQNFSFTDILPENVEYQSAKLYHGDKDVTSEYGTLKYDDAGHMVTYNLNRSTINKTSFYDGETLRLEIKTKAVNNANQVIEATNKAYTITNSIKQEVDKKVKINYDIPLTVKKIWQDGNNADGIRPDRIDVKLVLDTYMGGTKLNSLDLKTVTLSADNWSETVKVRNPINSLLSAPSYTYIYRWEEVIPEGYSSTQETSDNITTITNTHNQGKTTATVVKIWDDGSNRDGKRPDNIETELLADGEKTGRKVILNEKNNWTASMNDLDEKSGGNVIVYSWKEVTVPEGYHSVIKVNGTTTTITNKYNPETVTVTGIKEWRDNNNQDGLRPGQIELILQADGEDVRTFTLNEDNSWRAEYTGFKYKEGKEIKYTWTEKNVPDGYKASQSTSSHTTIITNTHEVETISLKCVKKWEDCDNQDGIRPKTIEIMLISDGNNAGRFILSDENNWETTVSSLDKYKEGKEIKYTWEEKPVTRYISTQKTSANTTTITNIHIPEKVNINVIKTWQDENDADGIRPDSIDVTLLSDGTNVNDYNITKDGKWKLTVENLDKYKNGKEIRYTWKEKTVTGYTADIRTDGYDTVITNRHNPEYTIITEIDQGTITETETDIPYGADRTIKWIPADGRYVSTVTVDDKDVSDKECFVFENITADHTVKVTTLPYHMITTKIDHGLITERIEKIKDTECKIVSWTPEAGYYVTKVIIDGVEIYSGKRVSGYPTSHTFDDIKKDYDIQIETKKIPNLTITKKSDKDIYNVDDEVTYTITAKQTIEGAEATNVVITDQDVTKGLEFDLSTVSCNIKDAVINTKDNSFDVLIDRLSYDKEIIITVKGKVNKDTLESKDIKNTVTIVSDQTEEKQDDADIVIGYNIITSVIHGTITESVFNIPYGTDETISYKPDEGYYFYSVKVDGENLDIKEFENSFSFKETHANHLIEVEYVPYHKVTTVIDHGTITDDKEDIKTGEDYTVNWTPETGYFVTKVIVNGVVFYEDNTISGYPTSYEFSNITENKDIKVETAPIPEETTVPETTITETVTTEKPDVPETTTQKKTVESKQDNILDSHKGTSPKTGDLNKTGSILFMGMVVTALIGIVVFDTIIICSKHKAKENKERKK